MLYLLVFDKYKPNIDALQLKVDDCLLKTISCAKIIKELKENPANNGLFKE